MKPRLYWIEASAGTGKTHTLTQTVVELVKEGLPAPQILLVTFTRKAAEELKDRIRGGIKKAWQESRQGGGDPQVTPRLEKALEDFPQLTIQTIHGFCHLALTSFPLESGLPFQSETLGERQDLHRRVRALLREKQVSLDPQLLQKARWEEPQDLVDALEEALLKDFFHKQPHPQMLSLLNHWQNFQGQLANPTSPLAQVFFDLQNFVKTMPPMPSDFFASNPKGVHGSWVKKPYALVTGLATLDLEGGILSLVNEKEGKDSLRVDYLFKFFPPGHPLAPKTTIYTKTGDFSASPRWRQLVDLLEAFLPQVQAWAEKLSLAGSLLETRVARYDLLKTLAWDFHHPGDHDPWREGEALTFGRMIRQVHRLVCTPGDSPLAQGLGERWKAALIDEFQDTDPLQWEIFRTLFDQDDHRLFLVGDPKQSIYGFRGADLAIYRQARDHLQTQGADFRVLDDNYRSTAPMIEACNRLFAPFFPGFTPSKKGQKAIAPVVYQGREVPPLRLFTLPGPWERIEDFRRQVFRHCVVQTQALLEGGPGLSPSDVLVLTDKNADSAYLLRLFSEKGIPAVAASDQGVFQSPQARSVLLFLQALENPRSASRAKALVLGELLPSPGPSQGEETLARVQERLLSVAFLGEEGAFLQAFRGVTREDEDQEGGELAHLLGQPGGERAYTNILHLLELTQEAWAQGQFPASRAAAWFEAQMEESNQEELSLRIDRDSPAVRIMTIHKAKGLESPVVFFCGGMSNPSPADPPFTVGEFADFLGTPGALEERAREDWEERLRLFYVAGTRPRALFCAVEPPADLPCQWQRFYTSTQENPQAPWTDPQVCTQVPVDRISFQGWKDLPAWAPDRGIVPPPPALKTPSGNPGEHYPRITSHTALVRDLAHHGGVKSETAKERDEELQLAREEGSEGLPAGARFGTLVHDLFEVLDYRAFAPSAPQDLVQSQKKELERRLERERGSPLARQLSQVKNAQKVLWEFLGDTLRLPLDLPGTPGLRLCDLAPGQTRREVEFHLRFPQTTEVSLTWKGLWPTGEGQSLGVKPGYLTGWIDLIFQVDQKLYIADWKTNKLAPGQTVEEVMKESSYDLQAFLYHQAVRRFPQTQNLEIGGVVYLFLRSASGQPQALFLSPEQLTSLDQGQGFESLFPREVGP